jgi:two-component system, sensor histidine kinase and response regulator
MSNRVTQQLRSGTNDLPRNIPGILIVDDIPANVLLLVRMLTERGYNTRSVLSGKLALQAAREDPPDLILLDINMPDMNGYEVCEKLKADQELKDIPVIFISALNETLDKVKAFRVGGVDYVTKPFQFEEVYARVQTHLTLRHLEVLRDDLTHMVVHDLNSPLMAIFGLLDVLELKKGSTLSATTKELVKIARLSAEELRNIIGSILDVSKIEAGEMHLNSEPFDLSALIREMLETLHLLPGNRTVTFDADDSPLTVTGDVGLIRRVLQNLIGNAVSYTPFGGDVRITLVLSSSEVRVSVIDRGPGIALEHHQCIFEKYGQVHDWSDRIGTGLGLTFCKLAMDAHGGQIGVESEVGHGSTFWFTLPFVRGTQNSSIF